MGAKKANDRDVRQRMGARLHITIPKDEFARVSRGSWHDLHTEAGRMGWKMEITDHAPAYGPTCTVYEGRPGEVWLASQEWGKE